MDDSSWKQREPWVVVDPDFKREWLLPQPLQYYLVKDENGRWFVCDRVTDIAVPETEASTRERAIRRFYKWCKRPILTGETLPRLRVDIAHQGETG